jgi:hypothetical protein
MNPTWMKQPGDCYVLAAAGALAVYRMTQLFVQYCHLANGEEKMQEPQYMWAVPNVTT